MARAFTRLERQVRGRSGSRTRYVPFPTRVAEMEKFLLELGAYLALHVANDPEDASDQALVAAYTDFKKHLEGTIV